MGRSDKSRQRKAREKNRLDRKRARFVRGDIAGRVARELELFDKVIDDAHDRVVTTKPSTDFENFQLRVYNRAFNIMKSIKLLVKSGHWEGAVGLARQLFEMSLNMEYIFEQENPEESAIKFVKYGLLQQSLRAQGLRGYWQAQGFDVEPDAELSDEYLESEFEEFKNPRPRSREKWVRSWNGKSTRKLAEESKISLRVDQYNMLFSHWSEQVHGSPGAFLTGWIPLRESTVEWVSSVEVLDEHNTIEALGNAVNLFYEISMFLPVIHITFDVAKMHPILEEFNKRASPPSPQREE